MRVHTRRRLGLRCMLVALVGGIGGIGGRGQRRVCQLHVGPVGLAQRGDLLVLSPRHPAKRHDNEHGERQDNRDHRFGEHGQGVLAVQHAP